MARAQAVHDELRKCGIEYLVWLPDSETRSMYDVLQADPGLKLIQVCREDEAIGVYFGLYLGGKEAAVLIQNTGMMNAVDALRGTALSLNIPLLLMVGYRGYHGLIEGADYIDSAAVYTEPLLKAMGIPYYIMDSDEDVPRISEAYRKSRATSGAVAVLVGKEYQ